MDDNIFERLKNFETHLRRGYYGGYIYGLYQKDFDELNEFYKKLGGRENLKYSCSVCTLRLVKFLGEKYFAEVERRKAEQPPVEQPPVEQPPVEQPPVEEPVVEEPVKEPAEEPVKKPRTRKKKEAE